ncbi:hypothetical protein SPRG_18088, partial [Saprolegnia parasitica CBS 223.65]
MSVFQFWKHDVTSLCASLHELLNDVATPDESDGSDDEDEPQTDVINGRVERLVAKLRHVFYGTLDRPVKEEDCKQVAEMLSRSHVMARLVTPSLLSQLSFETRKSVAALFRALVRRDQASSIVCDVALMTRLTQGYTA